MEYVQKIGHFDFTDEVSKKAYLKACKWIAKNLIANNENVSFKIEKVSGEQKTFRVTIFVSVKLKEVEEQMCEACREAYRLFYKNNEFCGSCKMQSFKRRLDEKLGIKAQYLRSELNRKYRGQD